MTPRLREWLQFHGDDPVPDWVGQTIAKAITTPPRVRQGTFSASSAGACLRAQELGFVGAPPTVTQVVGADLQSVFNDGKWRHLRWQGELLSSGILNRIEVSVPWLQFHSMNTLDGVGIVPEDHPNRNWRGEEFGFELKGVNPFWYPRWTASTAPQEKHQRQYHRYFLVTGFELFATVYENKATQAWKEWVSRPDKEMMRESMKELRELNTAVEYQSFHPQLPSCKIRMGPEWQQCPFAGAHGTCEKAKRWDQFDERQEEAAGRSTPEPTGTGDATRTLWHPQVQGEPWPRVGGRVAGRIVRHDGRAHGAGTIALP